MQPEFEGAGDTIVCTTLAPRKRNPMVAPCVVSGQLLGWLHCLPAEMTNAARKQTSRIVEPLCRFAVSKDASAVALIGSSVAASNHGFTRALRFLFGESSAELTESKFDPRRPWEMSTLVATVSTVS